MLFAALALLLSATHCVEIDDRDLEVTGGSGDDSDLPPECRRFEDDSNCFACEKAACCDELLYCYANTDCVLFVNCGGNCGDDTACFTACIDDHSEGYGVFLAFTDCGDAACGC
jgi:hypothetical protein